MNIQGLTSFILGYDKFILTAHETPDGDALGSERAMYEALKQLGKEVMILNADTTPHKYDFIDPDGTIGVLNDEGDLSEDVGEYVLLILDTNDINNIGLLRDLVIPKVREYGIIDHHSGGEDILSEHHIVENASSTCEILYGLITQMGCTITQPIAEALFVGIVYDTGSFVYPKTTAKTFRIAYELVSIGVEPNYIYSKIYESNSISSLILQSKVLSSLDLFFDNQVALQTMLKETVIECGASYEEADTFINIPLKSEAIRVSIFFKENPEGVLRCSLRSKGNIDVAEIAQSFGGGGHKTAAGFKCRESLAETRKNVLHKLEKYF
ncbi:MAG: DHH family phosphoesterase [Spirochaetia bacterium]